MVRTSFTHCPFYLLWCDTNAPGRRFNLHKTNAANEEMVSRLLYGRKAQGGSRYTDCSYHSNSLSNKMGNSLLAVREINHKYIVVERKIMQFIDLHRQFEVLEKEIRKGINNVYEHKQFIGGPEVKQLEATLAEYTGSKHVIACASGTDALTISLMAKNVKERDAIFVPSFSFFSSAESISLAGAQPVFVDCDEDTYNISSESLEMQIKRILEEGELTPKGIVVVDLFGLPANYTQLRKVADKYGLFILEDAAQGFGGQINGKKATSFGDIAATSFFPAKPLGCYGDGGAIFTDDDELANLIRSIHIHGQGSNKYDNIRIGLNSRLDTLQAVILNAKLTIFDEELAMRNKVASMYQQQLRGHLKVPEIKAGYISSWAQFTVRAKDEIERDKILQHLKNNNIPTAIYYPIPIHRSTAYANLKSNTQTLVTCDKLSRTVFSLPMHPYLKQVEIEEICSKIKEIL